jgi:predicted nuclease of predicted toxin-antitoxin system
LRFLIDAQLPPRLARRLSDLGHEATHVADIGLAGASDATIWNIAIERTAILMTKDQDFAIARVARDEGPAVIWIRIGNTTNEVLIARLINSLETIAAAIARGETVVELVERERRGP